MKFIPTLLSILIGTIIGFFAKFFSGLNPFIGIVILLFFLGMVIFNLILIIKEKNKKIKLLQFLVLIFSVVVGLSILKMGVEERNEGIPRRYYQE
ncbi:hypothetical protein [Croceivirga thetidis]|uniref:FUSC family protein n=1 Tax=Croceivirga thetidis TaxID=2721623 RepID=A0ABX1GQ12_9FLAO|nr:hypothetical protein [Croceivirga thetidis]NKI31050.1 hypothetical protein [Croceivirga thetidis]